MIKHDMQHPEVAHRVVNKTETQLLAYLEPRGGEYTLRLGEHAEIRVEDAQAHPIEWEVGGGTLRINSLATSQADAR